MKWRHLKFCSMVKDSATKFSFRTHLFVYEILRQDRTKKRYNGY